MQVRRTIDPNPPGQAGSDGSTQASATRRCSRPQRATSCVAGPFFFFNDTATTEIYTLSLHDALPILQAHAPAAIALWARARFEQLLRARTEATLSTAGLSERAGDRSGALSHGEQRQLEIAMVIATDPKVVLLDEPLAGMSGSESRDMVQLIKTLREGRAVLLVEHDMDAVFAVADHLTVMADGKVIASGAPEEVRRHPAVRAAYLGAETLHT